METMYALVKEERGPGLALKRVPIPETGVDDVKIKIHYTSICGTDLHIYNWDPWSQATIKPPITIGHEFVGEIVEMGSNVRGYKSGTSSPARAISLAATAATARLASATSARTPSA